MKNRHPKHISTRAYANPLCLSQASLAVLLTFSAAHAHADALSVLNGAAPAEPVATAEAEHAAPLLASTDTHALSAADGMATSHANRTAAPTNPAPITLNIAAAAPESVEFNSQFLTGTSAATVDISRFDKGNAALPGHYRAALYVNGVWIGVTDVNLRETGGQKRAAQPVFDRDLLTRVGVDLTRLPETARAKLDAAANGGSTALLPELIPQATATFDMGEQRLDVSVPQAMMSRNARGWVDPKFWDDGVPAATLQYNANVYHTNGAGLATTQGYLGLTAGANLGPWRFRYNGNVTSATGTGTHVQSMQTYLQRSFEPIKSQLTLGDSYTDGTIFDSIGVRGVQLATDDRMYPESQRGYAPTVRGIANSNAKVEVKQNGNIIYTTTVAPGAFEINDLYPTGYGGDLDVVVTEADGSQHVSKVPYAAPVNALREGRWRYNVAAGQYRNTSAHNHPFVFEAGVQRGVNNFVTLYGGVAAAEGYLSGALGAAIDTPVGAFGLDITQANSSFRNMPGRSGQSLRISYSRLFAPTNTNLTLAAYRYSTSGFLDLPDAMNQRDLAQRGIGNTNTGVQKGRLQLTLNQNLGTWGSVYASGFTQNYWNKSNRDTSYSVGYNTNFRRVGVGVSASRELDVNSARWDNRVMLNLSIPLDIGSKVANTMTSFMHDSRDNSTQIQETFTGAAGADNELSYGVTAGYDSGSTNGGSINANAGYLSRYTQLRGNAGYSNGYTQAGGGMSGTVVAYPGGVALTPQTGDTFAIVEAKDAAGARVATAPGVRVDGFGHAVVAGMEPYSLNTIEIDTKGLPMGVELKSTEQHFAPTAGAVVRVKFDTENRGQAVVMRLRRPNGDTVPFGADVLDDKGNNVGTISQGSRAMFYSNAAVGDLTVKWGAGIGQSCTVSYSLPVAQKGKTAIAFADSMCR
ncbi:fimbria/pilus outer membrane usher protein [Paraburkholderia sabiae]|uniref:Fimbria/pilus outer membrane usher protein n=1 Tax=Paraburkholderia sabiae TaxID=273251 RepID=A0ABU9QPF8_9BURK|nr:fimbria/pilus outer membrane usher protein [Paraburkholderia sabiae]WJZ74891.1 fimbria/pilus outer membrane usher protein [Paraburkholderia sabiae]CAD6551232.1 Outer membrane usher protein HtrE [Paraburkholderia sabiae]